MQEFQQIATLFKNFHVALYECQSSKYFRLAIQDDMLEHYNNQTLKLATMFKLIQLFDHDIQCMNHMNQILSLQGTIQQHFCQL